MFLPALVKTGIYYFIFQKRGDNVTLLVCFLIAFIPFVTFSIIPIHLPAIISFILGIAIQVFALNHYADIEIFPTGVLVIGIVEVVFYVIQALVL